MNQPAIQENRKLELALVLLEDINKLCPFSGHMLILVVDSQSWTSRTKWQQRQVRDSQR
jgi:hypothetical protein